MKLFITIFAILAAAQAQQTSAPGGVLCNYPSTGSESTNSAVPIDDFRTSGLDFVRRQWCITHCQDRKSLKASVLFQLANSTAPTFKVQRSRMQSGKVNTNVELVSGTPIKKRDDDPFNFCINDTISDQVDQIVNQYNDIETISEALNYFINKPGWAYLLYDLGKGNSITVTLNVKQDVNYCYKTVQKQLPDGSYQFFDVFSGLIATDSN